MFVLAAELAQTVNTSVLLLALLLVVACYQAYKKELTQLTHDDMVEDFLTGKD
jgi:hypothetical protein